MLLLFFVFDFPLFWSLVNCFLGGDRFTDGNRRCNLSIACLSFAGRKNTKLLTLSLIGEIECDSLCAMIRIRHFCHGRTDKQRVTTNSSLCTFLYSCRGWGVGGGFYVSILLRCVLVYIYVVCLCSCVVSACACLCVCGEGVGKGAGGGGGGVACVSVCPLQPDCI